MLYLLPMLKSLSQQIKDKYQLGPASHITHIENLESIVKFGIKSHSEMKTEKLKYNDLSNSSVQHGRSQKIIPETGKNLHDYVPLFFGWKSPMLMGLQDKNEDIIYLRFLLDILNTPGTVISDGNARSNVTKFYLFEDIDDLSNLNPLAINAVRWGRDDEKKRQKQAEILIVEKILFSQVSGIICYSEKTKKLVMDILNKYAITKHVTVNTGWYFVP